MIDLSTLPPATTLYLALSVLTWTLHLAFMGLVLGGGALLVVAHLWPSMRPLAPWLSDRLPLWLSLAITAGIGPLLFLQLLYRRAFYTAHLLLGWRFMLVVPVLIVAAYSLYLLKTAWARARPWRQRCASGVACLGFFFVAWAFTEQHLLSLASETTWTSLYARSQRFFWHPQLPLRAGFWLALSLLPVSIGAGRQALSPLVHCRLALLAMASAASTVALLGPLFGTRFTAPLVLVLAFSFLNLLPALGRGLRGLSTRRWQQAGSRLGCAGIFLTVAWLRESKRLRALPAEQQASWMAEHARAWQQSGASSLLAFLLTAGLGLAVLLWVWRMRQPEKNQRHNVTFLSGASGDTHNKQLI